MNGDPRPDRPGHAKPSTSALYVRIPTPEAEKLDRASFELKAPKQDLVSGLVARYVDPSSEAGLAALRELGLRQRPGADSRRVIVETSDDSLTVGRHSFRASEPAEVMTLEQVAELLQVPSEAIEEQAEAGSLPGRRIGGEWRFGRRASRGRLGGGNAGDSTGDGD